LWARFWTGEHLCVGRQYWLSRDQLPHLPRWPTGRRYNPLYDFPWFYAFFLGLSVIWSEPGEPPGWVVRVFTTAVFLAATCVGVEFSRRRHNRTVPAHT
jgi:hypothetical protein